MKQKLVAAILNHRKPPVTHVDLEMRDGSVERLAVPAGRYRAQAVGASVEALGDDAVLSARLMGRDGMVLQVVRLEVRAPAPAAPSPLSSEVTMEERHLALVGRIYGEAHERMELSRRREQEAAAAERQMAREGMQKALDIMVSAVERYGAIVTELTERERETSAREVELAAAEAAGEETQSAFGAVMKELPAALPVMAQVMSAVKK